MDATELTPIPQAQESDQPMTVDILRNLIECGALSIDRISFTLGLSRSGAYRYIESTPLKFEQVVALCFRSDDERVLDAFLGVLLRGSRRHVTKLPAALDLDGDGDVDTDDALRSIIGSIDKASAALKVLLHNPATDGRYIDARRAVADAADQNIAALAIIDFLEAHAPKRRKAVARG